LNIDSRLNPDFALVFAPAALIRAVSRWCLGDISGLKGAGKNHPDQGKACHNAEVSRR
jgi:hypothetical protein